MTDHGGKLSEITPEEVIDQLQDESDSKAIKRLMAAREYLAGQSPAAIAAKYGRPEQTIYTGLNGLESRGLGDGLHDGSPPGRPSKRGDGEEREEFREDSKKLTQKIPEKYTTIAIDQTRKAVGCDLYRAWFPSGERVSLPYWKTYEGVILLEVLTENGKTFVTEVADSFTSEVTVRFLRTLQTEFGDHLHEILDNATSFSSNRVAGPCLDDQVQAVRGL